MITVMIASIVNLGLICGLLAGIVASFVHARVRIATALSIDPSSGFTPAAVSVARRALA